MACQHDNPPGYRFCAICGAPIPHTLCRCGFAGGASDLYCGQCGDKLAETTRPAENAHTPAVDADNRFNLEQMVALAAKENQYLETLKTHVTQEDIRKLLAKRKRKAN